MDIEIIIKGAVELKEFYPKKYEVFVEQVGELILNAFPGVSGWSIEEEMTRNRYEQEKKRKQMRDEEITKAIIEVLKEPEFQDLLQKQVSEIVPAELPTA